MNLTLGAEPKKIVILGVLAAVLVALIYYNSLESAPEPRAATPERPAPASPVTRPMTTTMPPPIGPRSTASTQRGRTRGAVQDFRPTLGSRRPEDRIDPTTIDPTLGLHLLARLQSVSIEGGQRSLFEFSQPPPPKPSKDQPKIEVKPVATDKPASSTVETSTAETAATKPPPPPITLKFYGYINSPRQAARRAFFLDGEDILVAGEGDVVKKRYKIVRISVGSALVEDIEHKHQQSLPIVEAPAG